MVEIINQRKAFLDMLAWSEWTDNGRQKTRNHAMTSLQAESYLLTPWSPSQTCHAKPKTQINRRRTLPASFLLVDAYRKQLGLKDFLRKVRTLWHCSRLRSVALYLWLIVVISVRQSTVAAISGLHCRALVMVSSSIRLTAWLQNSKKRAERSERLMYEQSHRDYLRSAICIIVCLSWAVNHYRITPLPTKPSATKMPENQLRRTRQYWHADASAWCCCARCKIHEGVSWC